MAQIERIIPSREMAGGLTLIPNVATDLTTSDTFIFQIAVFNIGNTTESLTMQDRQDTPVKIFNALSISTTNPLIIEFPYGLKMKNGINWQASNANALTAEIFGYKTGQ